MAQQRGGGPPSGMQAGSVGGRPPGMQAPPGSGKALRRALPFLRRYWREGRRGTEGPLLVSATNLITPQFVRIAIDRAHHAPPRRGISAVIGLLVMALLRGLFTFLQGYLAERASQGVAYDLRDALFAQMERLGFSYYDRVETANSSPA